ncbi:MAG: metallophosphoesterase [Bacteroidales bacterium]|nr:metallophosphoesterase [Bacteroidales bacterium]
MNFTWHIIVIILATTLLAGIASVVLLKRHRILQVLTALFFIASSITSYYLCNNTRSFTDWHSFTYVQWWLFANIIIITTSLTITITRPIFCRHSSPLYSAHRTLCRFLSVSIRLIPALCFIYGAFVERYDYHVTRLSMPLSSLPKGFDGFRIALISDTHIGSLNGDTSKISAAIDSVNACKPDMVLFLGDLVNCYAEEAEGFQPVFKRINAQHKYAILGNHDTPFDYFNWDLTTNDLGQNINRIRKVYSEAGFTLLSNRFVPITCGTDTIILAGSENQNHSWLFDSAYVNCDRFCKIALIHSPEFYDETRSVFDADVTFCGHTHGGQLAINIPFYGLLTAARFRYKYDAGLFSFPNGSHHGTRDALLYVNTGLGVNSIPLRLGMPPEITLIQLKTIQ